jgi:cell division protein FtsQ
MATLRRGLSPPSALPMPMPADVRLMNAVANTVFIVAAVGVLVAGVLWLMRSPLFPIRAVQLDGELTRNNVPTIRANATPRLAGNFFSVDLQQGREAFESVPWVRRAVLRRVWPDRLAVRLEEHQAAALWAGEDGANRLVNSHGEVFDANVGDVEDDSLPTLEGPDGSAVQMLEMLRRLGPVLARADLDIVQLHLSGRGSWRADVDTGASIELGRGSADEVQARTERFVRTLAAATAKWRAPLEHADLRHRDGYALRLRGYGSGALAVKAAQAAPLAAEAATPNASPAATGAAKTN